MGWNRVYGEEDWNAFTAECRDCPVLEFFGGLGVTRWVGNCGPFVLLYWILWIRFEGVIIEGRNIELARRAY